MPTLNDQLFNRVPTNEEKRRYRELWGGIAPWRAFWGMTFMFGIGVLLGIALTK